MNKIKRTDHFIFQKLPQPLKHANGFNRASNGSGKRCHVVDNFVDTLCVDRLNSPNVFVGVQTTNCQGRFVEINANKAFKVGIRHKNSPRRVVNGFCKFHYRSIA